MKYSFHSKNQNKILFMFFSVADRHNALALLMALLTTLKGNSALPGAKNLLLFIYKKQG
jgi:hypothetical protein